MHVKSLLHMYSTYTTIINNQAPLSAGMQLRLLTDKQGSPPLLQFHWSHPLQLQTPHMVEALFGLGMVSSHHRLGSVPVGHSQNGNVHLSTPL